MSSSVPVLTLTTDFGHRDSYVACMKGVICGIAPSVHVIDLCHEVRPQDIRHGAYTLWSSVEMFPRGSVHVVVVDPGVGSRRRSLAVQAGGYTFVAPDNGVLWPALMRFPDFSAVALSNSQFFRDEISNTFHGRDIFSPVGAHLANGASFSALGPIVSTIAELELFDSVVGDRSIEGKLLLADHFGNFATNVTEDCLPERDLFPQCVVRTGEHEWLGINRTFGDVSEGANVAYINSFGVLELAVRNGSAEQELSLKRDTPVKVLW